MTTSLEGLLVRTGWFGKEFIPFDEVNQIEARTLKLSSGASHGIRSNDAALVERALTPPSASGVMRDDAAAFSHYISGAWSPTRAARALLAMATSAGASDVHIESEPHGVAVLFRCVGCLTPFVSVPPDQGNRLIAALKYLSGCLPYRRDIFQEGRVSRDGVAADVRASFLPTALGERVALRLFGRLRSLEELGFDERLVQQLRALLAKPKGLVLVAGSSGAGKTTTMYAALAHLAQSRGGAHLSLEDPVEQRLRVAGISVAQVELSPERGLTGEAALVAALRQDLDVLAVGEIRTSSEAELALKAAHTGRLVLAGIHSGSAEEARQRLIELGAERSVLETTLIGILHQRLETQTCLVCEGDVCARCSGLRQVRVPVGVLELRP